MPPRAGFPIPPFEWPRVGRQWPAYNIESDQADGLMMWMPWGGGYPGSHHHADMISSLEFTEYGTPTWVTDGERGWMLHFNRPDQEYLMATVAPVVSTPCTLSIWFVPDSNWGTWKEHRALCITDPAVGDEGENHQIYVRSRGTATSWDIRAETRDGAGIGQATSTITGVLGSLHLLTGVFTSATHREVFLDGVSLATNSTSRTPTGIDRTIIACDRQYGGVGDLWYGLLADARTYNRALTAADVWQIYDNPWELHQVPRPLWRLGVPVGITIGMDALDLAGTAQAMTQVSGAVSLAMDTLNLAAAAQALAQVSGAVNLAMDALGLAGSAQALTISVGAVALAMDALGLTGATQSLSVVPGTVALAMDALDLSGTAEALTQVSGAVALAMDTLNLTGGTQSLTVSTGIFIALALLGLAGNVQSLAVVPGEVTIALDELQAAVTALALAVLVVGGKLDVTLTDAAAMLLALTDAAVTALALGDAAVTALALDDKTRG